MTDRLLTDRQTSIDRPGCSFAFRDRKSNAASARQFSSCQRGARPHDGEDLESARPPRAPVRALVDLT